jgi:hypothetical protein
MADACGATFVFKRWTYSTSELPPTGQIPLLRSPRRAQTKPNDSKPFSPFQQWLTQF